MHFIFIFNILGLILLWYGTAFGEMLYKPSQQKIMLEMPGEAEVFDRYQNTNSEVTNEPEDREFHKLGAQ